MNQPKPEQEPSMEEILASIRRIISEDGDDNDATDLAPADEAQPEVIEAVAEVAAEPVAAEDDVLELTEVVAEQAEPAAEAEPEPEPEPQSEPEPVAEPEPETDYGIGLELVETVEDDLPPEPEQASEPPEMEDPLAQAPAPDDSLVADSTALMASAAMSKLKEASGADRPGGNASSPAGDKTLEALIRELLRPMLKEWLDRNLPEIVERIVEREVARVTEQLRNN